MTTAWGRPHAGTEYLGTTQTIGRNTMAWVVLFIAGLFEIGWAVGLKYTQGFTKLWPSVGTIGAMVVSFLLLSQALKTIPVGTGYAIWTGIGAVGTVIVGMALLGEPVEVGRIVCVLLIIVGIIGLKLLSPH
ncbi:MAG TPA: quaternary ammonium compound efflux SMR transporter SugE [Pyrinomonadaceae bacterium]|nr:quaternary ammonium compound efflux SMR transporter SugE [Pyrinomonadaceae bacterium]